MIGKTSKNAAGALLAILFMCAMAFDTAHAQWVPPRGEGSLSFEYQRVSAKEHIYSDLTKARTTWEDEPDDSDAPSTVAILSLDYGLYDRLALSVSLPFVHSEYSGEFLYPEGSGPHHSDPIDDKPQSAFQDLSIGLRYLTLTEPLFITTSLGLTWPTHDYATHGHSAIGRKLKTLSMGVGAGRALTPFMPRLYVYGSYAYQISEQIQDIRWRYSTLNAGFTYFPPFRSLSFSIYWNQQIAHSGVDWSVLEFPTNTTFSIHDRITAESFGHIGGTASYALTEYLSLYLGAFRSIDRAGGNTNRVQGLTLGTSKSF